MTSLVSIFVLLPLVSGFLFLFLKFTPLVYQRAFQLFSLVLLLIFSLAFFGVATRGEHLVYALGNWVAPFGIVLVFDLFSAIMLLLVSFLALCVMLYSIYSDTDIKGQNFHSLFQLQIFGINGAFLTGDLFNLFVFFEVLLLASYGLILHGGGRLKTKASLHYVVVNLVGSTLFLFAVATLYGVLGTLNIADLAVKISEIDPQDSSIVAAAGLMLLVVFGIKAAIFPLYLWLPNAYTHTSAPIAALFAIMTKVGIYAIIRVHGTIFGEGAGELAYIHLNWVLVFALFTMIISAFGVMAATRLKMQISYMVLVSVATILVAFAISSKESLSALLYYMVHSTIIVSALFLLADVISRARGEQGDEISPSFSFSKLELLGFVFFFGAISIAGMPPLSGFFGKLMILYSALDHHYAGIIFFTLLTSSFFVILSLARSGSAIFYNVDKSVCTMGRKFDSKLLAVVFILFSLSVFMVIFASYLDELFMESATQILDTQEYIKSVLGSKGGAVNE